MSSQDNYFEQRKQKALKIYRSQPTVYSPYFKRRIALDADGFRHLRYAAQAERSKSEQLLKFSLLPLAIKIIQTATTVQEHRRRLMPVGTKSKKDGLTPTKVVQWWGFVATFVAQGIKVRVVVRQVDNGPIHFWSTMPYSPLRRGEQQKLFSGGIEDG